MEKFQDCQEEIPWDWSKITKKIKVGKLYEIDWRVIEILNIFKFKKEILLCFGIGNNSYQFLTGNGSIRIFSSVELQVILWKNGLKILEKGS